MAVAYAPATPGEIASVHKHHHRAWWIVLGIVIGFMVLLVILGAASGTPTNNCSPKCSQPPPRIQPIGQPATYHSSSFGYSVSYDPSFLSPDVQDNSSLGWVGTLKSGGELQIKFSGRRAGSDSAEQIVDSIAGDSFPQFNRVYDLPGAEIGYVPGYGAVYDGTITPPSGQSQHRRAVILAAIHNGVAVTVIYTAPFHADDGSGFPDPAQLSPDFSQFTDDLVNSVGWK